MCVLYCKQSERGKVKSSRASFDARLKGVKMKSSNTENQNTLFKLITDLKDEVIATVLHFA